MKKLIIISALMFASTLTFSQTTVNIEPPTDDAYIYAGNPSTNYGTSPNLAVGYAGGSEMRMLIKWNLSSLPNCINITDAQIRLYQTTTNTSITADIERINGAWSELSVTWNNQPNTIGWYGSQTFSSTSGVKYIPATDLVNDWLTYGNNGVMFKINIGSSYQMFDSKEASGSDPRLIITYTILTPPSVSASSTSETCNQNNGSVSAIVSGGTTPYVYQWNNGCNTSTCTNLGAGTYSVTVTDNNGCTDVATTTINNISGPSATISSTQDETCNNSNGQICATATNGTTPYTYSWNNGQTSSCATGLLSGSYAVTVTDANNCTATTNGTISNLGQFPTAQFTASQTMINKGDCINFTNQSSGNPASWSWTFSGAVPSSSTLQNPTNICYNVAGNYQVSLTVSNSCGTDTESKLAYIDVNSIIGIKETFFNNSNIYPNPVSDKLIIELENFETAKVILLNVLGKKVFENDFKKKIEIDLSEYSEGVYFLNIETEKGITRRKIFVVK